jgi:signal transduction histidine kinase
MTRTLPDTASAAEELRRRNREATALYEIGRQIAASFEIETILSLIVQNAQWLLETHFAGVALFEGESLRPAWRARSGADRELLASLVRQEIPVLVMDGRGPVQRDLGPVAGDQSFASVLAVPLASKGKVLGVLVAAHHSPRTYTADEERLLLNVAGQAAVALENVRLYQATLDSTDQLRALTQRLAKVQEEERARVSRELHDSVGQALTAIRLHLELLQKETGIRGGRPGEILEGLFALADETLEEIRQMAFELRPAILDDVGLPAAVRIYAERFAKRSGIRVDLECPPELGLRSPEAEASLFRVIQEALTNVAKHAGAASVRVKLERTPEGLVLDVADDGCGFDPSPRDAGEFRRGFGILSMRERVEALNGSFTLRTATGRGTRLHMEVPLTP